jgi:heterodisulfide reductase subunit C
MTESKKQTFMDEVMGMTADGERLRSCLQCGTCGGSCPNGSDMDYTPRAMFSLIASGQREKTLSSNTMWMCVSCYFCTSRCPKQIPITDIMYTLKRMALNSGYAQEQDAVALAKTFTHYIDKYGRSFEFGIGTRYLLMRKPGAVVSLGMFGMKMFMRGRMHLRPAKIKNIKQLQAIMQKAREIEDES